MLGDVISPVAAAVEDRWKERFYDSDALPDIAYEAMREADFASKFRYEDVLRDVIERRTVPESYDKFSNFAQTVWRGTHMYVEFLVWLDATTSRHQHGFCGAFQVIHGASCHSTYDFRLTDRVNDRMELGEIKWRGSEILRAGDTQRIFVGEEYIHSLFHLVEPSVTLIFRSNGLPNHRPQWSYFLPSVRIDAFAEQEKASYSFQKKQKALSVAWRCDPDFGDELAFLRLESADMESAFRCLRNADRPGPDESTAEWRNEAHRRLDSRWPDTWAICRDAIEYDVCNRDLIRRRKKVTDPDHRFVLAMLMNVPDAAAMLRLVEEKFDRHDPHNAIAEYLLAMGVEGCGLTMEEDSVQLVSMVIFGLSFPEVLERYEENYGCEQVALHYQQLRRNYDNLKGAHILRAFFNRAG